MDTEQASPVPEEFVDQTRDVLAHFYDYSYLVHHPLVKRLGGVGEEDSALVVQRLRKLILDAIEQLKPVAELPRDDPAWRPYTALYERYILGKEIGELEMDLALGKRQIQREQHRGFLAVATALWFHRKPTADRGDAEGDDVLLQEVSRTNTQRQVFEAGEHLARALGFAQRIAAAHEVSFALEQPSQPVLIWGNSVAFRQILLSALSAMLRSARVQLITLSLDHQGKFVTCNLRATPAAPADKRPIPANSLQTLLALAASQKAEIAQTVDAETWCLQIRLPSADWAPVIAVVDDNKDLVSLLSRYMTAHGYRLVDAGASQNACERIALLEPDAIVLDIMMRDVDGWEVLQQIRTHPRLRDVPVAVCSVLDETELAACLGANAYLHKPIRPVQFLECLVNLLGQSQDEAASSR